MFEDPRIDLRALPGGPSIAALLNISSVGDLLSLKALSEYYHSETAIHYQNRLLPEFLPIIKACGYSSLLIDLSGFKHANDTLRQLLPTLCKQAKRAGVEVIFCGIREAALEDAVLRQHLELFQPKTYASEVEAILSESDFGVINCKRASLRELSEQLEALESQLLESQKPLPNQFRGEANVQYKSQDGAFIVSCFGNIDQGSESLISALQIYELASHRKCQKVVIDISKLTRLGGSSLGQLLILDKLLAKDSLPWKLCGVSKQILDKLRTTFQGNIPFKFEEAV